MLGQKIGDIKGMPRVVAGALLLINSLAFAESQQDFQAANSLTSPSTVDNQLLSDQNEESPYATERLLNDFNDWKEDVYKRTGLTFGADYNSLGFAATDSLGDDTAASGVFRLYGKWDITGRDTVDTGGLVFKFENRHAYTDIAPNDFGFELGYIGFNNAVFSDQGWRTTHLFWRQSFDDGRGIAYVGYLDITDYVDIYALASPWTSFMNLAFETGSGTIGGLPDGALGAMVGGFLTENVYVIASMVDANGDATDLPGGIDTFFNDFETFKSLEIGWSAAEKNEPALILKNFHLTFWQIDERVKANTPDGWGVAFSATDAIEGGWLPFIRGGYSKDGGSLYEASLSVGTGYQISDSEDALGIALNVSRPNETTFGKKLNEQYSSEMYYNLHLLSNLVVTPNVQVLANPALNSDDDLIGIVGVRTRMNF